MILCCSAEPARDSCHYGPVPPIDTSAVGALGDVDIQSSSSVSYPLPLIPADVLEIFAYSLILSFSLIFTVTDYSAERLNGLIEITLSIPSLPVETEQDCRQISLYLHDSQNCLSHLFLKISGDGGSHHTQIICQSIKNVY